MPFGFALHPKAVYIIEVVADDRHPCRLQWGILDERTALDIQLAEHVPFAEALFEPRALGLNAGVSLLRADDAAQVFVFNIFRSKVDKLSVHIRPVPFVIYNCRMPMPG